MKKQYWTGRDIPDLHGRTAVVTGANTGLGFAIASALAQHGADVVLACRNGDKAAAAADRIRIVAPGSVVRTLPLDLASLAAVRASARQLHDEYDHIDLLVNNAGGLRRWYWVTEDGFESTMAVNHLGPFAFTGLVLDLMAGVPGSRVVTVASKGHRQATIDPADLNPERDRKYRFPTAYHRAKLASLLFTYELNRRLEAGGSRTIALAGDPGLARTDGGRDMNWLIRVALHPKVNPLVLALSQSAATGALGPLRAATDPDARGGDYYGPPGRAQRTGHPVRGASGGLSHDVDLQRRLWKESERLTQVSF
ncbi:NAD(P)-dependent dehydrogenase (short-subunit alcohol dehydrogenase family) [Streptomyces aurantiacus]|uniref:oxidoreductase n=1 Tax=Streptomyces aurantiacus TaxID=47760 RepID=UPI0027942697|nr:oxidoreductase [Streptomyces aurantiacus]MDQ0779768.1 NAD(P)-dependent dehydrogenase (short-subunit alcohol dehydrogenase family) [Streptomyces aurantiacus]